MYQEQARKGAELMETFLLSRCVDPKKIYREDFSGISAKHPQDVLDEFFQLPGKKLVYYCGHTSLDGGWWFSWRTTEGIPDSYIVRPRDFVFGPPDRAGVPLFIVDG